MITEVIKNPYKSYTCRCKGLTTSGVATFTIKNGSGQSITDLTANIVGIHAHAVGLANPSVCKISAPSFGSGTITITITCYSQNSTSKLFEDTVADNTIIHLSFWWTPETLPANLTTNYPVDETVFMDEPPAPPTLTSPAKDATGQSTTLTLNWSDVTSATKYTLSVGTISAGNYTETHTVDVTGAPPASQYAVPGGWLSGNTDYYWRVKAFAPGRDSGLSRQSIWSELRHFKTV
jgi:hypothetical protein